MKNALSPKMLRSILIASLTSAACAGSEPTPAPGASSTAGFTNTQPLRIQVSWGHKSKTARQFNVRLLAVEAAVVDVKELGLEGSDRVQNGFAHTRAGAGDVDGLECHLQLPGHTIQARTNVQSIWKYLLAHSDSETVRRLEADPGYRPDNRKLTVEANSEGTLGFSLTADQLLQSRFFWIPELDMYVSAGDPPVSFAECQNLLNASKGQRVLDQLAHEPEASYEDYTKQWEDMGSPRYRNPSSFWPGHIVGITWDSAIPKFGIDRGANVWSDYGNPDRFYLGFEFGRLDEGLAGRWKGQTLESGLPIITTMFEKDGVHYEVEQLAYPLQGPPGERRGDIAMVLLEKVHLTELTGHRQSIKLQLDHRRGVPQTNCNIEVQQHAADWAWQNDTDGRTWLMLSGKGVSLGSNLVHSAQWTTNRVELSVELPAHGTREMILKLPSPPASRAEIQALEALDYNTAKAATRRFWSTYLGRGAQFDVPEAPVNTLFRANLWHALRLPRRHGAAGGDVKIDLPYSNFAYDQKGTPWPVNQAVYVDYMLYDLRGYHSISAEELAAIYRNNQEPNGHVGGFANWGVYTPSMIYSVAEHYLLSGDRKSFESLLPQTLKAFDWCSAEIQRAARQPGLAQGLFLAPLNDLSHEPRAWAFNQAYMFAGSDLLARALAEYGHPRAAECRAMGKSMYEAVQQGYGRASVQSPLVQLRDQTWIPYVPADALTPRRLMEIWYPTDVDSGALHMARLKALDPKGPLTTFLLHDHEDNLFLGGRGMANEPVYNQHATAFLLRDEPQPAIRAFYSMLACAFSHSVFEPVEHRWGWGQYFGPPSTDGAWFELYRNMLVREGDDDSLLLLQATPRRWLENGKTIRVESAPTYFGQVSLTVRSRVASGEVRAEVKTDFRRPPGALFLRLRHPAAAALRSVTVNGRAWTDFNPAREWLRIPNPTQKAYTVVARFSKPG